MAYRRRLFILLGCLINILPSVKAQEVVVHEQLTEMTTYPFSDPNPVPNPGIIYPYFRFDGYTASPVKKSWKLIEIENDYVHITITPEIGGKLWGAIEKSSGGAFLYYNHVVKFRDVAMRGPWTSGGLEYNFGAIGHAPSCASPVDYVIRENDDGSISCVVGTLDLASRTKWNVEIRLAADQGYVLTKTSWFNLTPLPTSYYHWMNAAAKASGSLEFIYPGKNYIGHGGEPGSWPIEYGRDIRFYENNNFGSYKSYHVINSSANFFGGYWHDDDFGFAHRSSFSDKPGKKLWIWGLSRQGMIWENLLTDNDGQYIEFQSGKLFNQAGSSSTSTPFKHREFLAHDADVMSEMWFPLVKTGGMVSASEKAVLSLLNVNNKSTLRISALKPIDDTLIITAQGQVIQKELIRLQPLELKSLALDEGMPVEWELKLGNHLRFQYCDTPTHLVKRPINPNPKFQWNSAYGWYVKGLELEKQRQYGAAMDAYSQCLMQDPGFMPALDRLALGHFRKMEWNRALDYAKQSLAIDTYDPLANYIFGLVNLKMGNRSDAVSGFSVAAASSEYRSSAYTELSRLYLIEKDFIHALEYSEKAISFNAFNLSAYEIMAIVCRYTHNYDRAGTILRVIRDLDPTHHFITFEDYLCGKMDANSVVASVQNELPHESFIEGALTYFNSGCTDDARSILEMAPDHPIVHLWLAYLAPANTQEYLRKVMDASPFLIFPFRDETAGILETLIPDYDHWKLKYYLGLIYWNKGRINEAKDLFLSCNAVDYAPFFLAKAELLKDQLELQEKALQMAFDLDPEEWRVSLALFEYYFQNQRYEQALEYLESPLKEYPENAVLGLSYARGLVRSGQYKKSISFLESFNVLPFEGATYGRDIYHEACLRLAFQHLENGDFKKTIRYGMKSLQWPEYLGAGKPYKVDERMEHVLIAHSFSMLSDQDSAVKYFQRAAEFELSSGMAAEHSNLIFQLMALDQLNMDEKAEALLTDQIEAYPDNKVMKWVKAAYENNPDAKRISAEILEPLTQLSINTEMPGSDKFWLVSTLWKIIQSPRN